MLINSDIIFHHYLHIIQLIFHLNFKIVFSAKYKIKLIALLIDHNLRKNSFKEITTVSNELKKFQIKTKILKIKSKITPVHTFKKLPL